MYIKVKSNLTNHIYESSKKVNLLLKEINKR